MDNYVRAMIRSSLVWLAIGVVIGLSMAAWPGDHLLYRPAHAHANLLGFVSMMIFGVAYHVLPRFTGRPLRNPRLAAIHVWVANAGLALQVAGFIVRPHWYEPGFYSVVVGGTVSAIGAFMFIYNIWLTLGRADQTYATISGRKANVAPNAGH
jgi:cytochrome c oxidase cbb3-type subunit 1